MKYTMIGILLLIAMPVLADIDVDPKAIDADNILIGGNARYILTITTDNKEGYILSPGIKGSVNDWIEFNTDEILFVSKSTPLLLEIMISPPKNTLPGLYIAEGRLTFIKKIPTILNQKEERIINIRINAIQEKIKNIRINDVKIFNSQKGNLIDIAINTTNLGNVPADMNVNVYLEKRLIPNAITIPPFQNIEKIINLETKDLEIGKNNIKIEIVHDGDKIFSKESDIQIMEQGTLSPAIKLIRIVAPTVSFENEKAKITAIFRNTGDSSTFVTYHASISKDNEIIKTIESTSIYAPIDRERVSSIIFQPDTEGKYTIQSEIRYGDNSSERIETILQVVPEDMGVQPLRFTIVPLIAVLICAIAFIIIARMRRKK